MTTTLTPEERFWSKVNKTDTCWLWTGARQRSGHGTWKWQGHGIIASRLAWILEHGEPLPGLVVCHRRICPNKHCCRPSHLYLGTRGDNNRDGHRVPDGTIGLVDYRQPRLDPTLKRCKECGEVKPKTTGFSMAGMNRQGKQSYEARCKECLRLLNGWRKLPTTLEEAFWQYVTPGESDACWLWQGSFNSDGYGQVYFHGTNYLAHHLSLLLTTGELVPQGQLVRHLCPGGGKPACVNPAHLAIGTAKQNAQDRIIDGTQSYGERHHKAILTNADVLRIRDMAQTTPRAELCAMFGIGWSNLFHVLSGRTWQHLLPQEYVQPKRSKGETHYRAKLTDEQVREIRAFHGSLSLGEIAQRFGVHKSTIFDICKGRRRKM